MEDLVMLAVLVSYVAFIVLDFVRPARTFTKVRFWRLKGLAFFVISMGLGMVLPFLWAGFVERNALLNLSGLGTLGGAAIGFVVMQLFAYWWHRLMHNVGPLWRWFHQTHHSAERLDVFGASYFHPLDILGFAFLQSAVPYLVFGVRGEAAMLAGVVGTFYAFFQHTNVRTPRWLGYLIQRPESHSVHHARGVHRFNYADLPLWDLMFGTFRNPPAFEAEAGFWDGASRRLGALLIGRDVAQARDRLDREPGTARQPEKLTSPAPSPAVRRREIMG
jgi:sterol desaturase/sphingolipid hydroxylase (fatty acid hydroxylase superfamily)